MLIFLLLFQHCFSSLLCSPCQASHRLETNISQALLPSRFSLRANNEWLWVIFGKQKRMKSHFCPDNSRLTERLWQVTSCSFTRNVLIYFIELPSSVPQVAEIIGEGSLWLSYCLNFWTLKMFFTAFVFPSILTDILASVPLYLILPSM